MSRIEEFAKTSQKVQRFGINEYRSRGSYEDWMLAVKEVYPHGMMYYIDEEDIMELRIIWRNGWLVVGTYDFELGESVIFEGFE